MGCRDTILEENREYWTGRASGYSEVNRLELSTAQRQKWKDCLRAELARLDSAISAFVTGGDGTLKRVYPAYRNPQ